MMKHIAYFFEAKKIWLSSKKFSFTLASYGNMSGKLLYFKATQLIVGINKSISNGIVLSVYTITYHSHNATYVWLAPIKAIA